MASLYSTNSVKMNGHHYEKDCVVVMGRDDEYLMFRQIEKILVTEYVMLNIKVLISFH